MRLEFDWDFTKARANALKHGVSFQAAMSIFRDPRALTIFDEDHSAAEDRWIPIGLASNGSLLVAVHTHEQLSRDSALIRIISARRPTGREIRDYGEGTRS